MRKNTTPTCAVVLGPSLNLGALLDQAGDGVQHQAQDLHLPSVPHLEAAVPGGKVAHGSRCTLPSVGVGVLQALHNQRDGPALGQTHLQNPKGKLGSHSAVLAAPDLHFLEAYFGNAVSSWGLSELLATECAGA